MARVAFIGLGVMGFPMAGHLAPEGPRRSPSTTAPRAVPRTGSLKHGNSSAATPAAAAEGAEIVFACVGNDDDLRSVTTGPDGAFATLGRDAVFVDHTTASAAVARELAEAASCAGADFVDAPVSGGQAGAENGTLTVMCGGEAAAYARAEPVIAAYARACRLMGPAGAGQLTKMVNQICIAGLLQGLSEGLAFAERAGLDGEAVLEVIGKGAAGSWQMENRGKTMLAGKLRLRLRRRLDAQGPRDLPRRGRGRTAPRCRSPRCRPVLQGRAADGRRPLGHLEPDPAAGDERPPSRARRRSRPRSCRPTSPGWARRSARSRRPAPTGCTSTSWTATSCPTSPSAPTWWRRSRPHAQDPRSTST